jgi:hypothetical protein
VERMVTESFNVGDVFEYLHGGSPLMGTKSPPIRGEGRARGGSRVAQSGVVGVINAA